MHRKKKNTMAKGVLIILEVLGEIFFKLVDPGSKAPVSLPLSEFKAMANFK
jgi:hypothetical protein